MWRDLVIECNKPHDQNEDYDVGEEKVKVNRGAKAQEEYKDLKKEFEESLNREKEILRGGK